MTADPESGRLIPRAEIRELLAGLMKGREHLSREPYVTRDETGWCPAAPLPADRGLRLANLLEALDGLPDPAPEDQAITAVGQVFRMRGSWYLIREIDEEWRERWGDSEPDAAIPAASRARCQACGKPLKAGSKASRRTCNDNCRQQLRRIRRRSQ